jgi:hypothetical protein
MPENPFRPAAKDAVKARIALAGPAGSGKSYTALMFATNLADRVAAIDTESGRLREHARRFKFDHFSPDRYDPRDLIKLLAQAADAGYGADRRGLLVALLVRLRRRAGVRRQANTKPGASKFSTGWKDYQPIENAMLDALRGFPGHVIVTMRVKTAYVVEDQRPTASRQPKKVGLKPEQREGADYEFSIVGEMDRDHVLRITKSTCEDLMDAEITKPGPETAAIIAEWCSDGTPTMDAIQYRDQALDTTMTASDLRKLWVEVKDRRMLGAAIIDEHGDDTTLGAMIARLGNERKPVALASAARDAA